MTEKQTILLRISNTKGICGDKTWCVDGTRIPVRLLAERLNEIEYMLNGFKVRGKVVVVFENGSFLAKTDTGELCTLADQESGIIYGEPDIIGNIYENPDLLPNTKEKE